MASPAPALLVLRRQIDERWPRRARQSDGIMGDAAHQRRKSAHNLGDAWDVTDDRAHGPNLLALCEGFAAQMRGNPAGGRLRLLIHDGLIWEGPSWRPRPYAGPNPHRTHAHIEVKHSHRGVVRPWTIPVAA